MHYHISAVANGLLLIDVPFDDPHEAIKKFIEMSTDCFTQISSSLMAENEMNKMVENKTMDIVTVGPSFFMYAFIPCLACKVSIRN